MSKIFLKVAYFLSLLLAFIWVFVPLYMCFVAASHNQEAFIKSTIPFLPGPYFFHNIKTVFLNGIGITNGVPVYRMLFNSLVMALCIAIGKLFVSILSAYALVFFEFPYKRFAFFIVFSTLMLPVEVRIVPTFEITASLGLLNHFGGLTLPLIASATATFLFRQFFMTLPSQLLEAAKLDGAGPMRIFFDIVLPLSKTNAAAIFIIMFIYGWNQYLWPLVITTNPDMTTIVMGIQSLASVADEVPAWHLIMSTVLCAMVVPVFVITLMQRLFEKGLLEIEK